MKNLRALGVCLLYGFIWFIVSFIVALIASNFTNFSLRDVLFVLGIILAVIGGISSINRSTMGLDLHSGGTLSSQYDANVNLESGKVEKDDKLRNAKFNTSIKSFSLILGGIISFVVSLIPW